MSNNFRPSINVAIIGASGGIGQAFARLFCNREDVETVYCFSRSPFENAHSKISAHSIDITNEDSIKTAATHVPDDVTLDVIVVTCGVLHADGLSPEKSLRDLSTENFERVFAVNTYGPALVAKHFLPRIPKDSKSVFAALSARVGSISDNRLGGWHAYRASKSALNMILKNTAIETARRYKQACIIGLHPGTVDTGLSKPFQGGVPTGKLFTPDQSAAYLTNVITAVTPDQSGLIFDWQGKVIEP